MGIIIISLELWCMVMVWGVLECAAWSRETGDSPLLLHCDASQTIVDCNKTEVCSNVFCIFPESVNFENSVCVWIVCGAMYKLSYVFCLVVHNVYFVYSVFLCKLCILHMFIHIYVYVEYFINSANSVYLCSFSILYV